MLNNKDYDKLAKEADNGLNGLGKIVKVIATLDQKSTQQQRKITRLTWSAIIMTAILLILAILTFFNVSFNTNIKANDMTPKSQTSKINNNTKNTKEVLKNKAKDH